jgi:hypothetical protein
MPGDERPKKKAKSRPKTVGTKSIVITVDDDNLSRIDEVASELRSLGVKIDEVLKATGLICGSTATKAADLKKVPGVMSVEEQTSFDVPPSDAPLH